MEWDRVGLLALIGVGILWLAFQWWQVRRVMKHLEALNRTLYEKLDLDEQGKLRVKDWKLSHRMDQERGGDKTSFEQDWDEMDERATRAVNWVEAEPVVQDGWEGSQDEARLRQAKEAVQQWLIFRCPEPCRANNGRWFWAVEQGNLDDPDPVGMKEDSAYQIPGEVYRCLKSTTSQPGVYPSSYEALLGLRLAAEIAYLKGWRP
jgi:hypothetical protein